MRLPPARVVLAVIVVVVSACGGGEDSVATTTTTTTAAGGGASLPDWTSSPGCAEATADMVDAFDVVLDSLDADPSRIGEPSFMSEGESLFGEMGAVMATECGATDSGAALSEILVYLAAEMSTRPDATAGFIGGVLGEMCGGSEGVELTFEARASCLAAPSVTTAAGTLPPSAATTRPIWTDSPECASATADLIAQMGVLLDAVDADPGLVNDPGYVSEQEDFYYDLGFTVGTVCGVADSGPALSELLVYLEWENAARPPVSAAVASGAIEGACSLKEQLAQAGIELTPEGTAICAAA